MAGTMPGAFLQSDGETNLGDIALTAIIASKNAKVTATDEEWPDLEAMPVCALPPAAITSDWRVWDLGRSFSAHILDDGSVLVEAVPANDIQKDCGDSKKSSIFGACFPALKTFFSSKGAKKHDQFAELPQTAADELAFAADEMVRQALAGHAPCLFDGSAPQALGSEHWAALTAASRGLRVDWAQFSAAEILAMLQHYPTRFFATPPNQLLPVESLVARMAPKDAAVVAVIANATGRLCRAWARCASSYAVHPSLSNSGGLARPEPAVSRRISVPGISHACEHVSDATVSRHVSVPVIISTAQASEQANRAAISTTDTEIDLQPAINIFKAPMDGPMADMASARGSAMRLVLAQRMRHAQRLVAASFAPAFFPPALVNVARDLSLVALLFRSISPYWHA